MALKLDNLQASHIEGYAQALTDLMYNLTGDNPCNKSYDPMQIDLERQIMHSYAFDMKDGGRYHDISDYESITEIKETLLKEAVEWFND